MDRPNILLITTDQQRFDTIAALGNPVILTPHLDWLCDEGLSFTRCYADCPICMPSRGTIMTGRRGYNTGCVGNYGDKLPMRYLDTLPAILTRAGYQTRGVGKMHFEPVRANYGFEHIDLALNYYREMAGHTERGVPKDHGTGENEIAPALSSVPESWDLTHWTVKKSVDFLETRDPTRPFFLWTSFTKPHPPFDPGQKYWDLYDTDEMPEPVMGDWSKDFAAMDKGWLQPTFLLNNIHRMSPRQMKKVRRAYYALITEIDYTLGILFARLRELNLLANTWIIFTSDHGEMLGDHHMGAKFVFQEGSAHVPLIIRPPFGPFRGHPLAGKTSRRLCEIADLFPTILSMAGVDIPGQADGDDLLSLWEHPREELFFGNVENHYFAIMDGCEKYLWSAFGGGELLFNLEADPMEQKNLAPLPENAGKLTRFRALMAKFVESQAPELVNGGKLSPLPPLRDTGDVAKWPGFHSPNVEADVLH